MSFKAAFPEAVIFAPILPTSDKVLRFSLANVLTTLRRRFKAGGTVPGDKQSPINERSTAQDTQHHAGLQKGRTHQSAGDEKIQQKELTKRSCRQASPAWRLTWRADTPQIKVKAYVSHLSRENIEERGGWWKSLLLRLRADLVQEDHSAQCTLEVFVS